MSRIRRALISVADKQDLVPLAMGLNRLGVEIVSTGGTAKLLKSHRIPVQEISSLTHSPEILGGRVKTLHPKIHGGILADRGSAEHRRQVKKMKLPLIDLVVVNLYPFEGAAKRKASLSRLIEEIDIGGVALLRAAAKNFQSVGVVSRSDQYALVLKELQRTKGKLSPATRKKLAVAAFAETAYYDALIHQVLAHRGSRSTQKAWPNRLVLAATRDQVLRYGENPHQAGAWYPWPIPQGAGLGDFRQLHGKELSFNNLLDLDAALRLVAAFSKPTATVVKHNNPCGVASAASLRLAFERAWACDPISAFGGIVGLNRKVDAVTARAVAKAGFLECIVAPSYQSGALRLLKKKKNLRILEIPGLGSEKIQDCLDVKIISGGLLAQTPDDIERPASRWKVATRVKPTAAQRKDLWFAWRVSQFVRSNAIVIVRGEKTLGIGAGQPSRVDSVRIAVKNAGSAARGAVLASDGFFPKPDGPQIAIRAGIRSIVQPGGSIQDPAVIQAAQRGKISMLLTGERHFKH